MVIGPSDDGGYVLIGARAPLPDALFADIPWSTDAVLSRTEEQLQYAGISYSLLETSFDVDTFEDLRVLAQRLASLDSAGQPVPTRTHALVQQVLANE